MRLSKNKIVWCDRGWSTVYYGFCPSQTAWDAEMNRLKVKGSPYPAKSDGRCTSFESREGKIILLVTISDKIDKEDNFARVIGLLVHEAAHVWQAMCRDMGEEFPSPEFEAYSLQHISMNLIDAYRKTRRPKAFA